MLEFLLGMVVGAILIFISGSIGYSHTKSVIDRHSGK